MTQTPTTPTPEDALTLDQVIREVTRRYRLQPADAQDFTQSVHVRLLERGYDVLERFDGRCPKRAYLSVVVKRLALDWMNAHYGKWRPSSAARRLGAAAVSLDRMIHRDGYSADTAIESLPVSHSGAGQKALRNIVEQLPSRARRRAAPIDVLERERPLHFDDPIDRAEQRADARFISEVLSRVVRDLPDEERRLLAMRYRQQQTVQLIASNTAVDSKRLYRRFDRTLLTLRKALVAQGVTGPASRAFRLGASLQPQQNELSATR